MNSHCLPTSKQVRRQRHYSCFLLMFGGWELSGHLLLDCFWLSSGNGRALLALSPARRSGFGDNSTAKCKTWALQSPAPASSQPRLPTCLVSVLREAPVARASCSCSRSSPISCLNCIMWRQINPCLPLETFPGRHLAHSKVSSQRHLPLGVGWDWPQVPFHRCGHTPPLATHLSPDHTNLVFL